MSVSLRERETVLAQVEEESRWVIRDIDHPLDQEKMQGNLHNLKNIVRVMAEEKYEIENFIEVIRLGVQLLERDQLFWGRMLIILLVESIDSIPYILNRLEQVLSDHEMEMPDTSDYHREIDQALSEDRWIRDHMRVVTRAYR